MNSINFCGGNPAKPIQAIISSTTKSGAEWHPVPGKVNVEVNTDGRLRLNNGITTLEEIGNGTYERTILSTGEKTIEKSKIPPKKPLNLIG